MLDPYSAYNNILDRVVRMACARGARSVPTRARPAKSWQTGAGGWGGEPNRGIISFRVVRARSAYVRSDPGENTGLSAFPFPFLPPSFSPALMPSPLALRPLRELASCCFVTTSLLSPSGRENTSPNSKIGVAISFTTFFFKAIDNTEPNDDEEKQRSVL